jgi:hypothetical protein
MSTPQWCAAYRSAARADHICQQSFVHSWTSGSDRLQGALLGVAGDDHLDSEQDEELMDRLERWVAATTG